MNTLIRTLHVSRTQCSCQYCSNCWMIHRSLETPLMNNWRTIAPMYAFPYTPAAVKYINNLNKTWWKHAFPLNSTLTLTLTTGADKIFTGNRGSASAISRMSPTCHMSTLVKGMTESVNQPIPLDTSRGAQRLCPLKDCHYSIHYIWM